MNAHTSRPFQTSRRGILATAGLGAAVTAAALTAPTTAQAGTPIAAGKPRPGRVKVGADVAAADGWKVFDGRAIGVITNPTGIVSDTLRSIVDSMAEAGGVNIKGVFGPEHGFRGSAQAGESEDTYVDERTGITVYDAYAATVDKWVAMFTESGVDTVVFDIQDVGVRFYTYIWTMHDAMIAAIKTGLSFIVLDRPNPIGGRVNGPMMTDGFTSGVGKNKILLAHGMTVGELAGFFNGELMPAAAGGQLKELQVVRIEGWKPEMIFDDTGLPWVMPSPNMPTPETALLYYGTGLFEAVEMSEGRGTTRPFELVGAPWVDYRWAEAMTALNLPGVAFREAYFNPTFSKHAGKVCAGVQVMVTDPRTINALDVTVHLFTTARDLYPEFGWRLLDGATPGRWIQLLTGSKRFQDQLEASASAAEIIDAWAGEEQAFDRQRQPYLLYKRK